MGASTSGEPLAFSPRPRLHRVRLLFRQVTDYGQLVHLALVRLEEQDDPEDKPAKADEKVKGKSDQGHEGHKGENRKPDMENEQGGGEKQALKRVEADEPAFVVRFHHQENDRRDNGDVSQHAGYVVRHASGGGTCWSRSCRAPARASWTNSSTVCDLSAARAAKSHGTILLAAAWANQISEHHIATSSVGGKVSEIAVKNNLYVGRVAAA
jgi:hypothetical protein